MKDYYDMDKYRLIDIYLTVNNLPIGCFKLSNIVYILSSEILFYTKIYRLVIIDDRGRFILAIVKENLKRIVNTILFIYPIH